MSSAEIDARIYRFGAFEVDGRTRQLLRDGRPVAIQPKPFDLLLYLLRHRDRLVPREELRAEVWSGVHVDDEAVRFTLHAARKAVGDDGSRQEVIRTVPRSGFQLVAKVEEVAAPIGRLLGEGSRTPFLGRDRLMARVEGLIEDAARGDSRILLLSGEAGIGKTRAIEQVADLAETYGFRIFRGRCVESEGAPAFWPWVQILRAAISSDPPTSLLRALGEGAREVAWMVPELRPFVPELPQAPPVDARAARFLMFDSVVAFFRELTAEKPHVVSIDDLHRADAASAALFHHVARELGHPEAPRLLLVGTYREGELRLSSAHAESIISLTTLPSCGHELLRGLELNDVETLVQALSGRAPGKSVVADLHQKTNGNPFFLHQMIGVLRSEQRLGELESSESLQLELPRHVQDAIRRQLGLLPPAARDLIELAAVIGGDFRIGELEVAGELDRALVLSQLGLAADAGVLGERAGDPDRYRFLHALVRDAIYAGLSPDVRARHHASVARALEQGVPDEPSEQSASIAHHYAHSSIPGDVAKAAHFYEMAASWSSARGAFEAAPEYLERALALMDPTDPRALTQRCRLLLRLGDALGDAGARDRAREVLQKAAALARRAGLREELATAALRFAPDLLALESGCIDPDLVQLLEEAIAGLGEERTALRASLLARLAIAHQWNDEQPTRSKSLCSDALEISAEVEDCAAAEYIHTASALVNFSLANPERQILTVSRRNSPVEILQRVLRVTSLMLLGRIVEVDAEIGRFADLVEHSRQPQIRWYVDLMRATRAQMEGRFDEASRLADKYLAMGSRFGDRNALQSFALQRMMAAFDTGRDGIEESSVREMVAAFPNMLGWRAGLALYLTECGRLDEARQELHRAIDAGALEHARPTEWYATFGALALSCGVLGEVKIASKLYASLFPKADQLAVVGYGSYCVGSTHRLLAALASALEQYHSARAHFDAAIAKNAASGAPACNGRVSFEYARMLFALGDRKTAIEVANHAIAIARAFKMTRLAESVDAFLLSALSSKQ